jgi:hypothetical protein
VTCLCLCTDATTTSAPALRSVSVRWKCEREKEEGEKVGREGEPMMDTASISSEPSATATKTLLNAAAAITIFSSFLSKHQQPSKPRRPPWTDRKGFRVCVCFYYDITFVTTPAPTVMPPSRMEKRVPSEMTVGAMSLTFMEALSPGKHAATPSGRLISPVTLAVRTKNWGR